MTDWWMSSWKRKPQSSRWTECARGEESPCSFQIAAAADGDDDSGAAADDDDESAERAAADADSGDDVARTC